ncbi:MAG: hypothetical protein MUE72_04545, partial [Chitinophagaceae bacterium]|nr:hypothetical protein [Chitinophagaceae bacterium]
MAFTIEEVTAALVKPRPEWPMYFPQNVQFQTDANYSAIVDYLTGKSSQLNNIQFDYTTIHCWHTLINLLNSLEHLSANDQLVIDVFMHPTLSNHLLHSLNEWIVWSIRHIKTDAAFQNGYQLFKRQGLSDDTIFELFAYARFYEIEPDMLELEDTPLTSFLLNHVKQLKKLVNKSTNYFYRSDVWSVHYFLLLEAAKPEYVPLYIREAVYSKSVVAIDLLVKYKEGKYLSEIVAIITAKDFRQIDQLQSYFFVAAQLYAQDANQYKNVLLDIATTYLDNYKMFALTDRWESNIHPIELINTD